MSSSKYVNEQRREYSLYVIQHRAIPCVTDGLRPSSRRVLWIARDGKKYKCATLAGATMPIHPHAPPESAINTLAATYGNNVPLLIGLGAFGTMLDPTAYGASRYTSVKVSTFTKDVLFRDIEIIPMAENYDSTLLEPVHFLPLIPLVLLNPNEGIAVGFASTILPRELNDIINAQIQVLKGKPLREEPNSKFLPLKAEGVKNDTKWEFVGTYKKISGFKIEVTNLPYGLLHEKFIDHLNDLKDKDEILDYTDASRDTISVEIKLKRNETVSNEYEMLKKLNLVNNISENMNVIDFDGQKVWSTNFCDLVTKFTKWRLSWYKKRYERLRDLLEIDIQKYQDIITAIKKGVSGSARKMKSRQELKLFLEEIGIVNLDYIADLPVYRFTEEEHQKVKTKLDEALAQLKHYKTLISSENERKKIYVSELKEIQKNYVKGLYNEIDNTDE